MKTRRLFDADATDGYLLDGKYWIDPLIAGVKTNADRFRAMTNEELADFLRDVGDCIRRCPAKIGDCISSNSCISSGSACRAAWLDWLKEEVKE